MVYQETRVPLSFQIKFYSYANYDMIIAITKLFKANPRNWQDSLIKPVNAKVSADLINNLIEYQNYIFGQITLYQQGTVLKSSDINLKLLIQNLEFLRLLCEDHNPIFQTLLINSEDILQSEFQGQILIKLVFSLSKEIVKIFTHNKSQMNFIQQLSNPSKFNSLIDLENKLT